MAEDGRTIEEMTPIRLLLFLHTLEPFGAQRTAMGIAEHLDPKAFDMTVCYWWGMKRSEASSKEQGCM